MTGKDEVGRKSFACIKSDGLPKRKFDSHSSARQAMKSAQKETPMHVIIYRCLDCRKWHIGKTGTLHEVVVRHKQTQAINERLAGKLVGALTKVLRPSTKETP